MNSSFFIAKKVMSQFREKICYGCMVWRSWIHRTRQEPGVQDRALFETDKLMFIFLCTYKKSYYAWVYTLYEVERKRKNKKIVNDKCIYGGSHPLLLHNAIFSYIALAYDQRLLVMRHKFHWATFCRKKYFQMW